jgi:hypothetical protein
MCSQHGTGGVFFARAQARNGDQVFWEEKKRNFMQAMGRPKHALKVPCFFFL